MAWSFFPEILRGAHPFSLILTISAPIWESGVMIRFMGRFWMEASPVSSDTKSCPARIPEMRRVVVPLLPTSRVFVGALRPWRPFPWTRISPFVFSMSMPIFWKQEMVERQSAPSRKFVILVVPSAREPNITALWEMDLSPGMAREPDNFFAFLISIINTSFIYQRSQIL